MFPSNFIKILSDYKKAFIRDSKEKNHLYNNNYSQRMGDFSQKSLWKEEASKAFEDIQISSNFRALDIGCNDGSGTEILSSLLDVSFEGIDISTAAIDSAHKNFPNKKDKFQTYDGENIPFLENSFDVICCMHVIGHVKNVKTFLSEIRRVMKPNGTVVIITPNAQYKIFSIVDSLMNNYNPDPTVRNYFFPKDFKDIAQSAGFNSVSTQRFGEKPLLLSWLPSESDYGRIRVILTATK
ncbi:class I SAM-dependent methyltransferase [Temperatibacter marinus]|uniref:Class I SAM-dependent methyltransferase n=1 Tax=Temperatibacter marinus TaxID=1456591 RepID=A0AA52EJT7_9PROT|nr:class I SAM-dependent methyltransferase [Temperatibacter marinus]WND03341.1 class I SAM-dependent methyltransferase [Temperatibacter marinus]